MINCVRSMFAPNPVAAGARCTISTEVDALTNNLSAGGRDLRGPLVADRRHRQNRRRRNPGGTDVGRAALHRMQAGSCGPSIWREHRGPIEIGPQGRRGLGKRYPNGHPRPAFATCKLDVAVEGAHPFDHVVDPLKTRR